MSSASPPVLLPALLLCSGCFQTRTFTSFLYCAAQNYKQNSRWGHTNVRILSFGQLAALCSMHPHNAFCPLGQKMLLAPAPLDNFLLSCSQLLISHFVPVSSIPSSQVQHPTLIFVKPLFRYQLLVSILSSLKFVNTDALLVGQCSLRLRTSIPLGSMTCPLY